MQASRAEQVAVQMRASTFLKEVGVVADESMAVIFALGRNLSATRNFTTIVAHALENGVSEREIMKLANTNVVKATMNASMSERVGIVGAILRAQNQGMELVDVVLQNASGHGVDLLFKNSKEMIAKTGREFAVVEAKGGATSLSALEKDTKQIRQGSDLYNRTRLQNFVDANPNPHPDVKAALAAAKNTTLDSYVFLGGADTFNKVSFAKSAYVSQMNKVVLEWINKRPKFSF